MSQVRKIQSLEDFKKSLGVSKLNVFTSKKGNKYCTNQENTLVASVAGDCDFTKSMIVFHMEDGEDNWNFIANGEYEPRKPEATI